MKNCTIIFDSDPAETYNLQYILSELYDIFLDNLAEPIRRSESYEILLTSTGDLTWPPP